MIVGGSPGDRGVVSAASYEARAFGVQSAMPLRTAARRCPRGHLRARATGPIPRGVDEVMAIFAWFTPLVEPISLDEAFLDVTASAAAFGNGATIARAIKQRVLDEVGLVVSVGVATNNPLRQGGIRPAKPDALVVVPPGEEAAFLALLPIRPAVGRWPAGPGAALADHGRHDRAAGRDATGTLHADSDDSATTCRRALAASTVAEAGHPRSEERRP